MDTWQSGLMLRTPNPAGPGLESSPRGFESHRIRTNFCLGTKTFDRETGPPTLTTGAKGPARRTPCCTPSY